jgi:hypothetical protein
MWHATYMQVNQVNSWFLVVKSQIANLTLDPSFGHNLCFKYSNGMCKLIFDMYVLRAFQWCKELFKPMSFDHYNCFLKIQKSIRTPIPKMGAHLGVCGFIPSHPCTLLGAWNVIPRVHFQLTPFASFCLGCKPKAKVTTLRVCGLNPSHILTLSTCTFPCPYFVREPKAKVVIIILKCKKLSWP